VRSCAYAVHFPDAGPLQAIPVLQAFPESAEVLATFPSIDDLTRTFASAGFRHRFTSSVTESASRSAAESHHRAAYRADTLLRLLPDEIYHRRLADLAAAAPAETEPRPKLARIPMVLFEAI
jgi:hypothetical protein